MAISLYGDTNPTSLNLTGTGDAPTYYQTGGVQDPNIAGTWSTTPPSVQGASTTRNDYYGSNTGAAAADLAAYDQAIANTQAAYDRTPTQLNSGYSDIDTSYQNALNQLLLGKNQANKTYGEDTLTTKKDFVTGKNTIGAQAGSSLNSILRLLGARGAGGSSAARISAPGAVARQATLQRNDLTGTFGKNLQALDTNWGNYLTGYNNQVSSAGTQRENARKTLSGQIQTNQASLLQTLAQLAGQRAQAAGGSATSAAQPYLNQANSLLSSVAGITASPINYQTQAYNAPSLGKYTTEPGPAPTYQGQSTQNDYYSPYLAALLGKKQQTNTAV